VDQLLLVGVDEEGLHNFFVGQVRAHKYDAATQVGALVSIVRLVEDNSMMQQFSQDYVNLVRGALRTHPESEEVHAQACITISDFCVARETSDYMMQTGVLDHVLRLLETYRAHPRIAELALNALHHLMEGSYTTTRAVAKPEVLAVVCDVMRHGAASIDVMHSGCLFVQHLANASRVRLLLQGGADKQVFRWRPFPRGVLRRFSAWRRCR